MRVVGLVTEYNPFHNGHLFHLEKALELANADFSVAVMSGHFLQRGEPALLNKWSRTQMALASGVDLVLELPYVFSCRSASAFALGAVSLLESTGVVSHICFGSEQGELEPLLGLARLFSAEPIEFSQLTRKYLKEGLILPAAQTKALREYVEYKPNSSLNPEILNNPNNILGIEYLRSLMTINSSIVPLTVKRKAAGYHDKQISGNIASATSIREFLSVDPERVSTLREVLPQPSFNLLRTALETGLAPVFWDSFFKLLYYRLQMSDANALAEILDVTEGLENRILSLYNKTDSIGSLTEKIKTKRYTWTRIQRVLNYILIQYKKTDAHVFDQSGPRYIRVLGASAKGRKLIARMRKSASLPVVTRVAPFYKKSDPLTQAMINFDIKASNIYTLGYKDPSLLSNNRDFLTGPVLTD